MLFAAGKCEKPLESRGTAVIAKPLQLFESHLALIPGQLLAANDNALFMALTGQQYRIAGASGGQRCGNRRAAVGDAQKIAALLLSRRYCYFGDLSQDFQAIFFPWIFI